MSTITYSSPSIVTVTRPKRSLVVTEWSGSSSVGLVGPVIFQEEGADLGHVGAAGADRVERLVDRAAAVRAGAAAQLHEVRRDDGLQRSLADDGGDGLLGRVAGVELAALARLAELGEVRGDDALMRAIGRDGREGRVGCSAGAAPLAVAVRLLDMGADDRVAGRAGHDGVQRLVGRDAAAVVGELLHEGADGGALAALRGDGGIGLLDVARARLLPFPLAVAGVDQVAATTVLWSPSLAVTVWSGSSTVRLAPPCCA
jgi:hypothetical protein